MKVELENVKPKEIETRSFEIITRELGDDPRDRADRKTLYPHQRRL